MSKMERITSHQVVDLMEAYNAIHAPQINEEQIWEEVETWVNSLVEEGYDLSEYTWEELYEEYITEIGVNFGGQNAVNAVNARYAQQKQSNSRLDAARAQRFGGVNPVVKASKGGVQGTLDKTSGKWTPTKTAPAPRPAPTAARPATPAPTAARPATPAPTAARPATPAPTAAPARNGFGAPTAPVAAQSSVSSVTAPAPASRPSLASQNSDIGDMIKKSQARQASMLKQDFDPFDVVLGHLIDEGYADTEQAALQIMANMSEEWRQSIVSEAFPIKPAIDAVKGVAKKVGNYLNSPSNDPDIKRDPNYNPKTGKGDYKDPRK